MCIYGSPQCFMWDEVGERYFDLTDPAQIKIVCHYKNIRPLWAKDNLKKSDSLPENYKELIEEIKQILEKLK